VESPDEYLTCEELAALLKVPVKTVRAWRRNGSAPPSGKFGRHVRFRRADVDEWAAQRVGALSRTAAGKR
jgi:excisionase family DNA binding protein